MIIDKESILLKLPKEVDIRDSLILDSIRFTLELIDYNYSCLIRELEYISFNFGKITTANEKNLIPLFNYSLGIIDNTSRLQKQFKLLPSPDNYSLIQCLSEISEFRNTFQHMHQRIDECLFENDMPFYGIVSWEINLGEGGWMRRFLAISGLKIQRDELTFKIQKKIIPENLVTDIILSTFIREGKKENKAFIKKEICLSDLIEMLKSIVRTFEKSVEEQISKHNLELSDWIGLRDILINMKY